MRVNREEFLKCLVGVEAGLSQRDVLEQSSCFVFQGGRVWTFNDEIACSMPLPKGLEDLECAVPAGEFKSLMGKMEDEELEVEETDGDEGSQLILKSKRRRAGIRVHKEIVLPVKEVQVPDEWQSLPKGFDEAISTIREVAGKDDSMPILTCLHIQPKGMEASDNSQAIRYSIRTGIEEPVLLKRDELVMLLKLKIEEWQVTEVWVHFRNASGLVGSCRRLVEKYPKLDGLFSVEGNRTVFPEGLASAIEKAEIFMDTRSDLTGVSVKLKDGVLLLRGEGGVGWYEEKQKVQYKGRPFEFKIAPRLLREVSSRSKDCVVGDEKLCVKGKKFIYVSCLVVE